MGHVVLLGDSVFDNGAYVGGGPDVVSQLREHLGSGWKATLLAVDGHVTRDVRTSQLARIPHDATHLVVSAGGNDALSRSGMLEQPVRSVAEALELLRGAQEHFRADYAGMVEALVGSNLPTAVSTIYDTDFPEPYRRIVISGLTLFNDVIVRLSFAARLTLLDMRLICDQPADFANPIEPSVQGGAKIARAIARFVKADAAASIVYTGR